MLASHGAQRGERRTEMPTKGIPAETLREGMWFKTPDGLTAYATIVDIDEPRNEVVVTYRSPLVVGTEIYPLGTLVPLTSTHIRPSR